RHQFVVYGAADPRLDAEGAGAATDQKIGRRLAGQQIVSDADRMIRPGGDNLVDIGAERKGLLPAVARPVELDRDERHVLDRDAAALGRGLEEIIAAGLALEHAGEQADQFLPADRAAAIEPGAVALDHEWQITAVDRNPPGTRGFFRSGLASLCSGARMRRLRR